MIYYNSQTGQYTVLLGSSGIEQWKRIWRDSFDLGNENSNKVVKGRYWVKRRNAKK